MVILPKTANEAVEAGDKEAIEAQIDVLLADYDENKSVPAYKQDCYCVGSDAKIRILETLKREMGQFRPSNPDDDSDAYGAELAAFEKRWSDRRAELAATEPDISKPTEGCSECNGTGILMATYNPLSKWDWWALGGRWAGAMGKVDPTLNPNNYTACWICKGTGTRTDTTYGGNDGWARRPDPLHPVIGLGCNACTGTGYQLKFASALEVPQDSNIKKLKEFDLSKDDWIPFGIVTPDGSWHEKAKMGWFAITRDNREPSDWKAEARAIALQYEDHYGCVVDCHI